MPETQAIHFKKNLHVSFQANKNYLKDLENFKDFTNLADSYQFSFLSKTKPKYQIQEKKIIKDHK